MDPKIAKADAKHAKIHSEKRKKDNSERKTGNEVFDKITLETLYKLANQGYIDVLNGAISIRDLMSRQKTKEKSSIHG